MTNREFYENDLIKLFAIDVKTNEMRPCEYINCCDCLFNSDRMCFEEKKKWLHEEYLPKIDWSKVKLPTMVEVSDDCKHWEKREFAIFFNNTIYCKSNYGDDLISWKYGKLIKGDNTES